jgi:Tfp pilus assembly protein PilO
LEKFIEMFSKSKKKISFQDKIQQGFLKKYALGVGCVLILVILWFVIFYNPIKNDSSNFTQNVNDWMQKIKMASVSKDAIIKLEQNVDTLQVQIAKIEERIYHMDDMQYIADELIKYSGKHQLNVKSMVPNYDVLFPVDEEIGSPLVKVPLEMKFTGRYFAVGRFLSGVDQLPFIFSPDEIFLEADARIYPQLRITISGYLFLLNEEKTQANIDKNVKKENSLG